MLFIHGRIPSLENCIFESMLTPSIFQVATKRLAMDVHRMTLKGWFSTGILISCPKFRRTNVSDLVAAGLAVAGSLSSMGREVSQEFEHHAQLCS